MGSIADESSPIATWLGAPKSRTGINVTEDVALSQSAVFCAVRRLSQSIARLPKFLMLRGEDDVPRKMRKDPRYRILYLKPNTIQTSFEFWELMCANLFVRGNAFAEIQRDPGGNIVALWWLRSDKVRIVIVEGEPYYVFTYPDGHQMVFDQYHMLHVPGFSLNGLGGLNTIQLMREPLGLNSALDAYASLFFSHGTNASGVLVYPGKLSEGVKEQIKQQIQDNYGGLDNAHRTMVLDQGMTWQELTGISPEDAQALQSRTFQLSEVARIWDIPPHMLADLSRATFTNIEHMGLEFVTYTLGPPVVRIEQRIMRSFFTDDEIDNGYYVTMNMDALLRGDLQSRTSGYKAQWEIGALTPDEARELEDRPPLADGAGNTSFVPVNYVPIAMAGKQQPQSPQSGVTPK